VRFRTHLCLLLSFPQLNCAPGLTPSTTNSCSNTNSINSTSSSSTSTSSMPTPIPPLLLRLHQPPHRPPPQHLQGRTRRPRRTRHRGPMTLREVTTPRQGATRLHLETTMPRQEAMMHLEATGHPEHMIHRELTHQREATPHPHRMSRHPHTGNPRPSAMITLTTRQNPLTDSPTPTHSFHTADVCVCMCIYIRDSVNQIGSKGRNSNVIQIGSIFPVPPS